MARARGSLDAALTALARLGRGRAAGPKHKQLRDALAAAIAHGVWAPGDKFPTETMLTAATPFSLGTVQRALRTLVADGLIERRQGSGTYVSARRAMEDPLHLRFLDEDGRTVLPIFPKIIARRRLTMRGPWSAPLGQRGAVIRLDRVIRVADAFSVYSEFYADARRFGALMRVPVASLDSANFKLVITREYKLPITAFDEDVRIGRFPRAIAAAIGHPAAVAGLIVRITARTLEAAVYYQVLYIPPTPRWLRILPA